MNDWRDIQVGETFRIQNAYGQVLDRTIISVGPKKLVVHRHEDEQGKTREVITDIFIKVYNLMGIPTDGQVEMDFKEKEGMPHESIQMAF